MGARNHGVDVRAITSWALFGSFDWNGLLTRAEGYYEAGAFDVRATAVVGLIKQLAAEQEPNHPVLDQPGWWQRDDRFVCPPVPAVQLPDAMALPELQVHQKVQPSLAARPILICGAAGTLGRAFARICQQRGLVSVLLSRAGLDIADRASVDAALDHFRPWAVINAAGYVRVDAAETDGERCFRENTLGPEILATACARRNIGLAIFSSDLVFGGEAFAPYLETDVPAPLNLYGRSKAEAEARVQAAHPQALTVRTSAFFGPWDPHNFVHTTLEALQQGRPLKVAQDIVMSPTYLPDLVHATLNLMVDGASGTWHLTNGTAMTWAELAIEAARAVNGNTALIQPCAHASLGLAAPRPAYSALATGRGALMPTFEVAMARFLAERAVCAV